MREEMVPLNLNVSQFAKSLAVDAARLNEIVRGRRGITGCKCTMNSGSASQAKGHRTSGPSEAGSRYFLDKLGRSFRSAHRIGRHRQTASCRLCPFFPESLRCPNKRQAGPPTAKPLLGPHFAEFPNAGILAPAAGATGTGECDRCSRESSEASPGTCITVHRSPEDVWA
jgi:hypothetical protein